LDNAHLSRLRNDPPDDPDSRSNEGVPAPAEDQSLPTSVPYCAGDCTLGAPDVVPGEVVALIEASIADRDPSRLSDRPRRLSATRTDHIVSHLPELKKK
jgi:hypothetical protein